MVFKDRVSAKPNRYKMTSESTGSSSYVTLERADEPTTLGTPLNAETLNTLAASIPKITYGSAAPSGGSSGDIYFQYI